VILSALLFLFNWQQNVSYDISAYLDINEHLLTTTEQLIYCNNSPYALDTLFLFLHANAYRSEDTYYAREAYKMGDERFVKAKPDTRGYVDVIRIWNKGEPLDFIVDETIIAIPLREKMNTGDSICLQIEFCVKIPIGYPGFGYRSGDYAMTHWYPKMCVFDEEGWHHDLLHPLGSDYGEFGTYDVTIELPGDYVVVATGKTISRTGQEFLDTLSTSAQRLPRDGYKRAHFHAENVDDFIWFCGTDLRLTQYRIRNIDVNIFYRPGNEKLIEKTYLYVKDAIFRFTEWFGEYPYGELNVVDGFQQVRATYPQVVPISLNEDPVTRLFEVTLVTELARQWFGAVIGPNMTNHAWLGDGFATYAAIRYMEDKYGKDNSMIKIPFLPALSLRYLHRFLYYVIQTNRLEKPVSTPAYEYVDVPISYQNSTNSKPALFLFTIEKIVGKETFDEICRQYYQTYNFKHAKSCDFINICEEVSGQDLAELFTNFLNTTEFCDWQLVSKKENTVEIENIGELRAPVDLHITTESGEEVYAVSQKKEKQTITIPATLSKMKRVALDPSEYILEPNYWNNYLPRKVSVRPFFDFEWPSFSTYQVLWTPYVWYDSYDGVTAGFYLFGDNFADADFVKGGYQVTAGYKYGFGSSRPYPLLNYQTPVIFEDGKRVRIRFSGSRSRGGDNVSIGISSSLGRPFTRQPQITITNMFSYDDLATLSGLDSIDWDLGRNITFDNNLRLRHAELNVDARLSLAHHALGSEWEYLKMTLDAKRSFAFAIPFSMRLFVGKIFGEAPAHERLFLSGALRTNLLGSLLFGQSGKYSPQERIHIPGNGSMCGYQTLHIKSNQMYALNLEFPTRTLIRIFTDIGYYDEFAFDVGVRLAIGSETLPFLPLYGLSISANFPLYTYLADEPWKFRWSFGFSL
jgi:hypothetical protein